MPQFGTAPRKVNGVWVTAGGRRLSPAGQRYWEKKHQQGFVDVYGHTRPFAVKAVPHPKGLLVKGNIDIQHRPHVRNPDGTVSSVRSIGITDERGRNIVIPTVVGNKVVSDQQAVAHYNKTGQHLGVFKTQAQADRYAQMLHQQQARMARPHPKVPELTQKTARAKRPSFETMMAYKKGDPEAVHQVRAYLRGKKAAEGINQAVEQVRTQRTFGPATPAVEASARATRTNPIAASVIKSLSPTEAAKETYKAAKKGNIPMAGLAAASIFPVGRGVRAAKAIEEGVQAAKTGEMVVKGAAKVIPGGGIHEVPGLSNPARIAHLRSAGLSKADATALARSERVVERATAKATKAKPEQQVALQKNLGDKVNRLVEHQNQIETKYGQVLPAVSPEARGIARSVFGSESGYKAQQAIQSQERGQRAAKLPGEFEAVGGGEAGVIAKKRALQGAYTKVPFNDLASVDKQTIAKVINEVEDLPHLQTFEKFKLQEAIRNAANQGIRPRPHEVELMAKAFGPVEAAEFANTGKSMGDVIAGIANIPRSIMASGDLSAPFRQGLMAFMMHPTLAAKQMPRMVKDFGSERSYQARIAAIKLDPEYENSLKAGVSYTELGSGAAGREEQFMSKAAETVTGGKYSFVRASGRAYTGFLDGLRLELYKSLRAEARSAGLDLKRVQSIGGTKFPSTLDQDIGNLVNWATGRGTFKHHTLEGAAPLLNSIFFSPRLFKSRLDAMNPNFYRTLDPFARKQAANAVVRLVATGTSILGIAAALGAKIEIDPRSSDWGKIRVGKTRYDIWGGYQQIARTIAQEIMQSTKSSTTGKTKQLESGQQLDPLFSFFKGKLSPPAGLVMDVKEGKMFGNQPVTLRNEAYQKLTPILWQDIYDAIHTGNWANAAATTGFGALGVGTQTYSSQLFPNNVELGPVPKHRHPKTGRFVTPKKDPSLPSWAPNNRKPAPRRTKDPNLPTWAR